MLLSLGLGITIWLSTALMTWGWIKLAKAKQIQDAPERRRMHDTFIPRAGGIGIALAMSAASVQIYFSVAQRSSIWLLLVASIVLFSILGFWDDLAAGGNNLDGLGIFFVFLVVVILSMRIGESIVFTVKESGTKELVSVLSSFSEESGTEQGVP